MPLVLFIGVATHPQSTNTSLNGFAMFNCTAIATSFTWEINGILIDDGDLRDKGFDDSAPKLTLNLIQNLRTTSLRVLGSPDSNNTNITCVAIIPLTPFTNDADRSEPALMLVQGNSAAYQHMEAQIHVAYNYNIECK